MITKHSLQKVYESKVGTAFLSLQTAIAGSKIDAVITYTVGETGIDDSGSMKILLPIVTDFGVPQFTDAGKDNFVTFETTVPDLMILPISNASGYPAKIHTRPWSKGMQLVFKNTHLAQGETVKIRFKNWNVQTFCEKKLRLKILVDPFGSDEFIEVPADISLEIKPDKPEKIVIIAPTQVEKNKTFSFLVKAEDKWGNACFDFDDQVALVINNSFSDIPQTVVLQSGRALVTAKLVAEFGFIQAKYNRKTFTSNPILAKEPKVQTNMYWADLHGQTEETVGTGTIEEYFEFAQKYSLLDVSAHQGNDFQITQGFWKKINQLTKKITKPEKFIAFPGYEWSGNSSKGGDRNVLYLKEGNTIFRSSHALVDDISDIDTDAPHVKDLFSRLKGTRHIVMAHVGGRYADMSTHDPKSEKLVEVHSVWGTFEWILFEALKKGYKVGVMANSDGHDGRVGSSYPGFSEFNNYGGLTCILSPNLTRESVFTALRKRHCYGTTGNRMFIDQKVIIGEKELVMGDQLPLEKTQKATIELKACGTQPIDLIQVFDTDTCIYSWSPEIPKNSFGVKILWSGSKVKGRNRKIHWNGTITTDSKTATVKSAINFFNPAHSYTKKGKNITFAGATTGGVQGIIVNNLEKTRKISITTNGKSVAFDLHKLSGAPTIYDMGGLDAKLELSKVQLNTENKVVNLTIPFTAKPNSNIFIKITQVDGHMAWTSPVFL